MKNILKYFSLTILTGLVLAGCQKVEDLPFYNSGTASQLTASTSTVNVTADNVTQNLVTLSWTNPQFATDTSNYKYVVEIAPKGTNFADPVKYTVMTAKYIDITGIDINNMLVKWGANYGVPTDLEVRVLSSYANNNDLKTSNVVDIKASAYAVPFTLSSSATGPFTPTPQTKDDILTTLNWTVPDYGTSTVTYSLQYAKSGTNFASVTTINIDTDSLQKSLTAMQLYQMANNTGITLNTTGSIDVRIAATVKGSGQMSYSNTIVLQVKPIEMILYWYVPGGYQGWDPTTAPAIGSDDGSAYEGYIYAPEQNYGFHFTTDRSWAHEYGDDGTASGKLAAGSKNIMWPANPGYYLVKVNTTEMTYSLTQITTWGVIGDATPGGWDTSTPLTYDATNKVWKATVTFSGTGGWKFRANNGWDINLGASGTTYLKYGGDNVASPSAGVHTVTLDLNNPLRYTYTVQ